jgi:hypothetical protein
MEAILNCVNDKEDCSNYEQTRSSIDHTFGIDRFMPGEKDGLRGDFLDDVHSVHHIASVPRRQIRHASARQPAVQASARRRRITNACESASCIRLRQCPITLDKPLATWPATHMTTLSSVVVAALTPALARRHFIK